MTDEDFADNVIERSPTAPFGARWWRNWFDHSPDAQFILDTSGIIECNAQALRVLGHVDKSRIVNREPASLSPELQSDGTPSDRRAAQLYCRPDHTAKFDWLHVSFDGTELPVEVVICPIDFEDRRLWLVTWHDIGERLAALDRLAAEKSEAVEANQSKSDFLANVSHEIRTPMNGVLGMVDLLLNTDLGDRQRDCAMTIRDSGTALLNIINDILDLSKMEAGKLELECDPFDPYGLIDGVAQLLAPRAREKNLELPISIRRAAIRRRAVGLKLGRQACRLVLQDARFVDVAEDAKRLGIAFDDAAAIEDEQGVGRMIEPVAPPARTERRRCRRRRVGHGGSQFFVRHGT